jgi:endonuclease I
MRTYFLSIVTIFALSNQVRAGYNDCDLSDLVEFYGVSVEDYYASALGKTGMNLRSALHSIISADVHQYSYDCVFKIVEVLDENVDNDDEVIGLYTGKSIRKSHRDGAPNTNNDSWNREHVWAKSHGFGHPQKAAFTDIHHIRVADRSTNTHRGTKDFANIPEDTPGRKVISECIGGCAYVNDGPDNDGLFEPPDRVKGEVARIMFYMDVRYEGDRSVPDLELTTDESPPGSPRFGLLCDLLSWHHQFGVTEQERVRNENAFSFQGNRNPFVDHPEWADELFGSACQCTADSCVAI